MAGHSHWAGIKHKKARMDAQKGKAFSKLSRAIISAARQGGGDPDMNLTLKYAIDAAKAANMPKDNIARAVKKGSGGTEGVDLESILYEGYWQGGVAVMVDVLTDNRKRTGPEVKKIFERRAASLGTSGCVAFMFDKKCLVRVAAEGTDEDAVFETALDAGAEDVQRVGESFEITGGPDNYQGLRDALEAAGYPIESGEYSIMVPQNTVPVKVADKARKLLLFMEELDDHDDVQKVYSNFDIPDEVLAELAED